MGASGYEESPAGGPADLEFVHVGARWYDPSTGRFLQRDPIGIDGGLNVYNYADGNAASGTDPDGFNWIPTVEPPRDYLQLAEDDPEASGLALAAEHKKGQRPSTHDKHTKAQGHSSKKLHKAKARLIKLGKWFSRCVTLVPILGCPNCGKPVIAGCRCLIVLHDGSEENMLMSPERSSKTLSYESEAVNATA